ncbi:M17 family peptidase N-terminal domain-containing protein [Paludisphaera mucosa]|uniref:M17 family peptidase N-terminal domain-containing protein n=1 Tax=Paludisphaera mucosa TaxID=3030827 RepID=A0ABT6FC19_9BACT|nr:M17 family peptidase N-terminal domain-containing protein [Paludisphaera mucosa]MDG3004930.1 M17 family peptidase N-terminal domain-containing protein [Paludisphaera mucosa]
MPIVTIQTAREGPAAEMPAAPPHTASDEAAEAIMNSHVRRNRPTPAFLAMFAFACVAAPAQDAVREEALQAPGGLPVKVRMEGPYTADVALQIVCYFRHKPAGDVTKGAAVELDRHLGGVVAALRDRGEFAGEALETILIVPPKDAIKARSLLLIGLGDEGSLSLERMEQVGKVALREAVRLRADRVAFAPLIRDQGDSRIATGAVAQAVARGAFLAYDTEKRLQAQGLAAPWTLEGWEVEAGPAYFDETVVGLRKAVEEAGSAIAARGDKPYRQGR